MNLNRRPEQTELSDELIRKLLAAPDKRSLIGKRDLAILRLLLESGVRVGELINLCVCHLIQNQDEFSIQVKTLKKRRSKDKLVKEKSIVREIPLTTETVNSIFNYWKLEYGVVFPEDGNKPFF